MKQKIHYLFMLLLMLLTGVGGVKAQAVTWVKTAAADLQTGDVVVIVDTYTYAYASIFALPNDGGTSKSPVATKIALNEDKSQIAAEAEVPTTLQWVVTANNGSYKFGVSGTDNFLYCTNSNSGLRVGTNQNNAFEIKNNYLYNTAQKRYIGVYSSQDWRSYTSINDNIQHTAIAFYKKVESGSSVVATTTTIDASDITNTDVYTSTEAGQLTASVTADGTAPSNPAITWTSSNETVATIDANGNVTLVAAGTTTITASYAGVEGQYQASYDTYELTVTSSAPVIDYATLPFNWEGGTSNELTAMSGVTGNSLGDYAAGNAPYRVQFNADGDYIQVKTDGQPGKVTIGVKMIGGANTSKITVQGSADGETFTDVEELTISGTQNKILELSTTNSFAAADRYVRLLFTKGSNVGVGPISIEKPSIDPVISANDIEIGYDVENGAIDYEIINPVDGGVVSASTDSDWLTFASNGTTFTSTTNEAFSARTASVILTYTYGNNKTVTKEVTITQAGDPNAPGTQNNPYTVAQARAAIDAGTGLTGVYATGVVSEIVTAYNSQYGNITYNISADGTKTAVQLQAYRGMSYKGEKFTSEDDVQVGDVVVVYGNLKKYNSTYEFDANNQLVSLVRNTLSAPTFSVEAGTYKEELSVTINCATEGATIYYSFDNENWTLYENPVTISESKTLYAKAEKGDKVEIASAEYTILIDKEIQGYKYEKVTSTEDITDGQYLIVYEDGKVAFDGSLETLDAVSNTMEVTIENNGIAATTFKQAAEFTIDVTSGTLKSASGKYIGVISNDNGLKQTETESSYKNSFAIDEDDNAVISAVFEGSTMTLRFNSASNQNRFRYYKSGQQAIQLYKLVNIVPPAAPTFSPEAGTFTAAQDVTISTTTDGAEIYYTTDGSEPTTSSSKYSAAIPVNSSTTIKAIAVKNELSSSVAEATYTIEIPEPVVEPGTPAAITAGFYTIKNLGNNQFVNVAGRKTVTFVDETATAPGTVIKVESNEKGQVQVLRSQGVDLPGYAERAMKYVPKIVQLVAEKLGAEGEGNLLGKDGLGKIMDKFNESFDYHLYTEQGEQGVRIYGKTPSMQPVVDFYNDNKANVDAKLPMLEDFINSAIRKVLDKTGGSGASILTEFSLHEIWDKMGKTLKEPVDADSKLEFLQGVLSDKQYVWDFAYQTAMKYWKPLISHKMVQQKLSELGDLAQYVEKIEYIRPDVKYYIVQKNGKIDFISQDNTLLKETSSEWELTERKTFTVKFDEQNVQKEKYYTTLYTDFAYTLPEGAKAMTVTKVAELNGKNIAITETIKGAVPAQTPVLLESATAGDVELTLDVTDGTAIVNLLKGNDWLVNLLNITTPQVDKLFGIVHDLLEYENMGSLYDRYVKEYEYLKKRNAGTVNNKYFFALSGDDIAEATTNICQFTKDEQGLAFSYNLEQSPANKAFLPGDKDPVYLSFVGDVNRDGKVSVADVNALVEIVLGKVTEADNTKNYDFEAAHVNADEDITIADVTALVNIILK